MRGALTVLEMTPNEEAAERFDPGLAKFVWLNRLKNSARNCSFAGSLITKSFDRAKSVFQNPGPVMKFLGELPKPVPSPITGAGANTFVLKY